MKTLKVRNAEVQELLNEVKKNVPDISKQFRMMELIGNAVNSAYDAGEEKATSDIATLYDTITEQQDIIDQLDRLYQDTVDQLDRISHPIQIKIPAFMMVR